MATKKEKMLENPDLVGVVQSLAAPVFRDGDFRPRFAFAILVGGNHVVLDVFLDRPGADAAVAVVCAAYQSGVGLQVGLLPGLVHKVDWVQVPKPRPSTKKSGA